MQLSIKTTILSVLLATTLPVDAIVIHYSHNQAGGVTSRYSYSEMVKMKSRRMDDESSDGLNSNNSVKVYPTIVDDNFVIEIISSEIKQEDMTYSLFSVNGQVVFYGNLGNGLNSVDLQGHPSGLYLLKVMCGTDCSTYKIIKK